MTELPNGTLYGVVEGRFGLAVPDTDDVDDKQDFIPAKGSVLFVPSLHHVIHEPTQTYIFPKPVPAKLDEQGKFSVSLIAADSPDFNPTGLAWDVKVSIEDGGDLTGRVAVKAGVTTNVSKIFGAPKPPDGTVTYVTYDDTELRKTVAETRELIANLPASDAVTMALTNAEYIDTKTAEVFHLTYTQDTIVSVHAPGRTSFIAVVDGYSHITWDAVTVHGDVDVSGLVWGTFVWDSEGWRLFVEGGSKFSQPTTLAPYVDDKTAGLFTASRNTNLREIERVWGSWEELIYDDNWFKQDGLDDVPILVERRTPNAVEASPDDATDATWRPPLVASELASKRFVQDNFVPLERLVDEQQNTEIRKIPNGLVPSLHDLLKIYVELYPTSGLLCVGMVNQTVTMGTTYSSGYVPIPETDGSNTPSSIDETIQPGIAYHTGLDKMVMWSPKSKSWRNLDGTPL